MKIKDVKFKRSVIRAVDMEDGQVGIINNTSFEGELVQRWGNHLVLIGTDDGWECFFDFLVPIWEDKRLGMRVRILPAGTTLTVEVTNFED